MARILVTDPIAREGVALLEQHHQVDVRLGLPPAELKAAIGEYEGLVVRSETKVTADVIEAGQRLQVIGRAGVGVDNIDLDAATRRGVTVVNAPTGNVVAAAEHTVALMLAMARNIAQADASLRRGEWRRRDFVGVGLRNKTLGIVGLGNVGSEVARRARPLVTRLLAFDPFVPQEYARALGVELTDLDTLLSTSDFITIHTPLTDSTRGMIGKRQLDMMKPGVRLVNVARGGLVDEQALAEALESGKVAGAALDVFDREPPQDSPLLKSGKVVATPHLGGSTAEAQVEVAREVAEQVMAVLRGEPARFTVNLPFVSPEVQAALGPYIKVAATLGRLAVQLAEPQLDSVTLEYRGEIAAHDTGILTSSALAGLLGPATAERVNLVNARLVARQRGLNVLEQKGGQTDQYSNLVSVEARSGAHVTRVAGTVMRDEVHLVRVNDYWLDMVPTVPYLLFIEHVDRPGMIGAVGTITGRQDINIAFMEVGRLQARGGAMMVVGLDDPMPEPVLAEVRAIPQVRLARLVRL
ncbi:MAG: phosphoglycerate dehydrogenase [Chloroflexi bacterium]|nr:phosphoglycerate dehydrogenase [Chloroflexota bacterium]